MLAQDCPLTLAANFADGVLYSTGGQGSVAVKHPHPLLFVHARPAFRRAQNDMVLGAFEFQRIAGADLQGVTHGFGQDDAASLIDGVGNSGI